MTMDKVHKFFHVIELVKLVTVPQLIIVFLVIRIQTEYIMKLKRHVNHVLEVLELKKLKEQHLVTKLKKK